MKRLLMLLTTIKTKAILATLVMVIAICASVERTTAAQPSATPNPFAGTYCGYLDSRNYGSMSISDSGSVSGYFSYFFLNFYESFKLSGRVTAAGVMRLKVVHTITVRDRGVHTSTERYSVTVTVTLDGSGNLVATSGASFVLSPCQ
ncbi:MAG: hypothetical protein WD738_22795 [Pirellulales bacterium]